MKIKKEKKGTYKMPDGKVIKTTYKKAVKKWQSGKHGTGYEKKETKP